jgi:hypothetical protein
LSLVSVEELLGLAARIMRPASKATDTSVSWTACKSTDIVVVERRGLSSGEVNSRRSRRWTGIFVGVEA